MRCEASLENLHMVTGTIQLICHKRVAQLIGTWNEEVGEVEHAPGCAPCAELKPVDAAQEVGEGGPEEEPHEGLGWELCKRAHQGVVQGVPSTPPLPPQEVLHSAWYREGR